MEAVRCPICPLLHELRFANLKRMDFGPAAVVTRVCIALPMVTLGVVRKALFLGDTDEGHHPAR
jgi:hypothetical protein